MADYYFLVNQDVELTENCLEPLIELMESDVNIAACQPKILAYHDKHLFEHAGAAGGYIDKLGYVFAEEEFSNHWKMILFNIKVPMKYFGRAELHFCPHRSFQTI